MVSFLKISFLSSTFFLFYLVAARCYLIIKLRPNRGDGIFALVFLCSFFIVLLHMFGPITSAIIFAQLYTAFTGLSVSILSKRGAFVDFFHIRFFPLKNDLWLSYSQLLFRQVRRTQPRNDFTKFDPSVRNNHCQKVAPITAPWQRRLEASFWVRQHPTMPRQERLLESEESHRRLSAPRSRVSCSRKRISIERGSKQSYFACLHFSPFSVAYLFHIDHFHMRDNLVVKACCSRDNPGILTINIVYNVNVVGCAVFWSTRFRNHLL